MMMMMMMINDLTTKMVVAVLVTLTRNSSGDEITNVNFLYHIVHVLPLAKAPSSE